MNKELYEVPVSEVITFENEDVITTSNYSDWDLNGDGITDANG